MSKPIWDALKDFAYADDSTIRLRCAGKFDLSQAGIEELDLTTMPDNVADDFFEMLDQSDHIIYIEIGKLDFSMFKFSLEIKEIN